MARLLTGVFLVQLIPALYVFADDIETCREMEFSGFNLLSKKELILRAGITKNSDGLILVNRQRLSGAIEETGIVSDYSIRRDGERLVIEIKEKDPGHLIAVKIKGRIEILETDEDFRVLSVNRPSAPVRPVVVLDRADLKDKEIRDLFKLFEHVRKDLPVLYREVEEVRLLENNQIRIRLKGRRSVFVLNQDIADMKSLQRIAGFLDSGKSYPLVVRISGSKAIIR